MGLFTVTSEMHSSDAISALLCRRRSLQRQPSHERDSEESARRWLGRWNRRSAMSTEGWSLRARHVVTGTQGAPRNGLVRQVRQGHEPDSEHRTPLRAQSAGELIRIADSHMNRNR
jgi:hypothetical protein